MLKKLLELEIDRRSRYWELLQKAVEAAKDSPDPSTKVGACLLVNEKVWKKFGNDHFTACNTFSSIKEVEEATREERYEDVIHAEENLILKAGLKMRGGTVFMTHEPCSHCWRLLVASGISKIVFYSTDQERRERWRCTNGRAIGLLAEIEIEEIHL